MVCQKSLFVTQFCSRMHYDFDYKHEPYSGLIIFLCLHEVAACIYEFDSKHNLAAAWRKMVHINTQNMKHSWKAILFCQDVLLYWVALITRSSEGTKQEHLGPEQIKYLAPWQIRSRLPQSQITFRVISGSGHLSSSSSKSGIKFTIHNQNWMLQIFLERESKIFWFVAIQVLELHSSSLCIQTTFDPAASLLPFLPPFLPFTLPPSISRSLPRKLTSPSSPFPIN